MSTFKIESDAHSGEFDTQYPIHLQGLITPQEFAFIVQNANTYLKRAKSLLTWNIVSIVAISILYPVVVVGSTYFVMYQYGYISFLVIIALTSAIYMITLFGGIFWFRKKQKTVMDELKTFVEYHNQQTFLPRGVQILVKYVAWMGGYNYNNLNVYLEVIVAPNAQRNVVQSSPTMVPQPVFVNQIPLNQPVLNTVQPNILQYQREGNPNGGYAQMK
jgi:hypothetical protein